MWTDGMDVGGHELSAYDGVEGAVDNSENNATCSHVGNKQLILQSMRFHKQYSNVHTRCDYLLMTVPASECPRDLSGWILSLIICFCPDAIVSRAISNKHGRKISTKTLSSGKPPSAFRSHTRVGVASAKSQTRNLPAVSSEVNGTTEIEASSGGGNVKKSSVATHCAL